MTADEAKDWSELDDYVLSADESFAVGTLLALRNYLREESRLDIRKLSLREIIDLKVKHELYRC